MQDFVAWGRPSERSALCLVFVYARYNNAIYVVLVVVRIIVVVQCHRGKTARKRATTWCGRFVDSRHAHHAPTRRSPVCARLVRTPLAPVVWLSLTLVKQEVDTTCIPKTMQKESLAFFKGFLRQYFGILSHIQQTHKRQNIWQIIPPPTAPCALSNLSHPLDSAA